MAAIDFHCRVLSSVSIGHQYSRLLCFQPRKGRRYRIRWIL